MKDFFKLREASRSIKTPSGRVAVLKKRPDVSDEQLQSYQGIVKKRMDGLVKDLKVIESYGQHMKPYEKYIKALYALSELAKKAGLKNPKDTDGLQAWFDKPFPLIRCCCIANEKEWKGSEDNPKAVQALMDNKDYRDALGDATVFMNVVQDIEVEPLVDKSMRSSSMSNWPWMDPKDMDPLVTGDNPRIEKEYARLYKIISKCPASYTKDVKSTLLVANASEDVMSTKVIRVGKMGKLHQKCRDTVESLEPMANELRRHKKRL